MKSTVVVTVQNENLANMVKIGIVEIRKIAFTKQRKEEVYTFYNDVVRVINRYDTKAMYIGDTCDVLIAMHPKAELLRPTAEDEGPHLLTPKVDRLHERRLKFAAIITNQMRTLEKADLTDTREKVKLTKPIVYSYLNYLRQNDKSAMESAINGFLYELELKPEVKAALYELGFKTYLGELKAANSGYENTYAERHSQLSRRPKGSTLPVQRELQYMMNILFNQVNYYQHVYKDIDYSGLITALNYTIAVYTKLIKTRDTKRKNKKLKAQEKTETALEEKTKMEGIEKNQSDTADTASATIPSVEVKENQKETPSTSAKNLKGKEKPISGLLHILKKKDMGDEEGD